MPQRLETKNMGSFIVDKSWIVQGVGHVAKLMNGGYIKVGGQAIKSKQELKAVIPKGPDLDDALEWFENRGKIKPATQKKIVLEANGDIHFDDGSPIYGMSDLINNIPPGAMLDAAIKMFVQKQMKDDSKDAASYSNAATPRSKEQDAVEKLKADLENKGAAADDAEEEAEQEDP